MQGYTQEVGIDYTKTFSPVVKMTVVRTLIGLIVERVWELYQLDVNNVLLYGGLNNEVYMTLP